MSSNRPTHLGQALSAHYAEQVAKSNPNAAAAQKQFRDGIEADAKLHGTPAWDALPASRKALVSHHELNKARQTQEGGQQ